MGDKGTNTTTQNTAPNPAAMAAYRSLMDRAGGVANTPYQAYTGNLTAGVNAQQNLGIGNINTASQAGSPWFDYAASMAHPISQSDIERYQNPYTQHVVDATQAQFDRSNAQQQEGLKGREISQGALGGSRARISAADMGYQQQQGQAPVIAGLYNQSYNQALTAAQQQQQAGFQGAGVGANIQQAGLQGAGAQIGAGTLQQQAEQAALSAQYGQYQVAQAFPYQQTQWLAGVDTGVGSQMGGTSTTTAPAPSLLGQVAGAGVAGVGMATGMGWKPFAARGGRIDYDAGGSVGSEPYGGVGFIPQMKISGGHGAPSPPGAFQPPKSNFDPSKLAFPRSGAGNTGVGQGLGDSSGDGAADEFASGMSAPESASWGSFLPEGLTSGLEGVGSSIMSALPEGLGAVLPLLALHRGGGVRGYAEGGAPEGYGAWGTAEDLDDAPPPAGVGAPGPDAWGGLSDTVSGLANGPSPYFHPQTSFPTVGSRPSPDAGAAFMKARAPAGVAPPPAYDDMAYDDSRAPAAGVGAPPPSRSGGFDWSSLSMPLMAAGLGMMASRSPHPGVAIGEGGLAGVQAYAEQKRQTAEQGLSEKKQALDARRLDQLADQSRAHLRQQTRQTDIHEQQVKDTAAYRKDRIANEEKRLGQETWKPTGLTTEDGHTIVMNSKNGHQMDASTGTPIGPDIKTIDPRHQSPIDDASAKRIAEQYVQSGNRMVLAGYARNPLAQGMINKNITDLMTEKNISADDMAHREAEWEGRKAGQRVLGTVEARMTVPAVEAKGAINLARDIIDKVPRTSFLPLNKLIQGFQNQTLNPDQYELLTRLQGVKNVYAAVMNRGAGTTTVSSQHRADELLNSAADPAVLHRTLDTMLSEIDMAIKSPEQVRDIYRKKYGQEAVEAKPDVPWKAGAAAAPKSVAPAAGTPKVGERKQFKQGWGVWDGSKWAPEKG